MAGLGAETMAILSKRVMDDVARAYSAKYSLHTTQNVVINDHGLVRAGHQACQHSSSLAYKIGARETCHPISKRLLKTGLRI